MVRDLGLFGLKRSPGGTSFLSKTACNDIAVKWRLVSSVPTENTRTWPRAKIEEIQMRY